MKILFTRKRSCPGIYAIENKINGKLYVGKAKCIYKRLIQHRSQLKTKSKDENRHLISAYHKYGPEAFVAYIIEKLPLDEELISKREHYWILKMNVLDRDIGYNLRLDSSTGLIVSDETRRRCSIAQLRKHARDPSLAKKVSEHFKKFWKMNPEKKKIMADKVSQVNSKQDILKMDFKLNILEEFPSIHQLLKKYPNYYRSPILSVCNGSKNSYKGFIWRYRDKITGEIRELPVGTKFNRSVIKLDKFTNTVLDTWGTAKIAGKALKYSTAHVNKLAKTQEKRKTFNYYLKYEE